MSWNFRITPVRVRAGPVLVFTHFFALFWQVSGADGSELSSSRQVLGANKEGELSFFRQFSGAEGKRLSLCKFQEQKAVRVAGDGMGSPAVEGGDSTQGGQGSEGGKDSKEGKGSKGSKV